ncbi:hypothetical protein NQZ68_029292 [Dissostichus eleginoides]|nr:hypothetical protein NQZ68_029292 [Dissostichus eleginoides]
MGFRVNVTEDEVVLLIEEPHTLEPGPGGNLKFDEHYRFMPVMYSVGSGGAGGWLGVAVAVATPS